MKCIQIVFLFILSTLLFACNNLIFRYEQSSLDGKYGKFGLNEALEFTELNQPVEFAISVEGDPYGMSLSLDGPLQVNTFNSENGQLVVTDPSLHHLKYIPKYGFRGKEEFTVFSRDRSAVRCAAWLRLLWAIRSAICSRPLPHGRWAVFRAICRPHPT